MGSGQDALRALAHYQPAFHRDAAAVADDGEHHEPAAAHDLAGAGGGPHAIGGGLLEYLADLPGAEWTSVETGCGYTTVVLANACRTHVSVDADPVANRLVREFVERHAGATGLRHVERSSDQGLPILVEEGLQADLALLGGAHRQRLPLLEFHYIDKLLKPGGRLLVDDTESGAVQELTDHLEHEPAYKFDRLVGACAVFRKVQERQPGSTPPRSRPSSDGTEIARREVARLRMELAPELRAVLTGASPLPPIDLPEEASRPVTVPARATTTAGASTPPRSAPSSGVRAQRLAKNVVRWYLSPSGLLAAAGLTLLALGLALPDLWRLVGLAGIALLGLFLPYRFLREQRRTDTLTRSAASTAKRAVADEARALRALGAGYERAIADARRAADDAQQTAARVTRDLGERVAALAAQMDSVTGTLTELGRSSDERFRAVGGGFQPFSRVLTTKQATAICEYWNDRLGLEVGSRHVEYIGRRLLYLEAVSSGRMATTASDGIIRSLAARSLTGPTIRILEIGTLFGIGAALVVDVNRPFFERIELTLLDPLDGYYGREVDPPTGVAVTRPAVEGNFARIGWPADDLRILQGYSTDDEILAAASDGLYDLLILDGDHSYDGIRLDFERYAPLVKPAGLLIVDDYGTPDWPDVGRYTDDVIRSDNRFDFIGAQSRTAIFRRGGRA